MTLLEKVLEAGPTAGVELLYAQTKLGRVSEVEFIDCLQMLLCISVEALEEEAEMRRLFASPSLKVATC